MAASGSTSCRASSCRGDYRGNYNLPDQWQMPLELWLDIVLPSLTVDRLIDAGVT